MGESACSPIAHRCHPEKHALRGIAACNPASGIRCQEFVANVALTLTHHL